MTPPRLLRILALTMIVAGFVAALTLVLPHGYAGRDSVTWVIAVLFVLLGGGFERWSRHNPGQLTLHLACLAMSALILGLSWVTLPDLGGIAAVFLFLPLVVNASTCSAQLTVALLIFQACGYAVVLRVDDSGNGFNPVEQWQVLILGLVITALYQGMVRRTLLASQRDLHTHASHVEAANDELRAADEVQRHFMTNAAHELRTPLTSTYGFAQTLLDRWNQLDEPTCRELVQGIVEQSGRMSDLVDDLLLLSRIEGGDVRARPRDIDVHDTIEHTLQTVAGVDVDVHTNGDGPWTVHADPSHLRQVLAAYLTNARAYGDGPVWIEVAERVSDRHVEIRVCDSGPGVAPDFAPRLFTRFARASSHTEVRGRTGLGLSIAQALAQLDGGSTWYEPGEPHGARFCVAMPPRRS